MKQEYPKLVLWDNPEGWDGEGGGGGVQDEGDTCIPMADSYWCVAKNHRSIVKVIILQLNKIFKKEASY